MGGGKHQGGFRCQKCGAQSAGTVIDSRVSANGDRIRRRRECSQCRYRWTTYECPEHPAVAADRLERALRAVYSVTATLAEWRITEASESS